MSTEPLVSIVVPFLDPLDFMFREAVESILGQTYGNLELLLVDDGSGRGSLGMAGEWVERDPRVRLLTAGRRGAAAARNIGIRTARGEYLAFLDADDLWMPDKLERQVAILREHPEVALTYCAFTYWFSWAGPGARADGPGPSCLPGHCVGRELEPPQIVRHYLHEQCIPGTGGMLLRRAVALELGGFDESLTWSEDQTLPYKIGLRHRVYISPERLWKYRMHPYSTTAMFERTLKRTSSHIVFLRWVAQQFREDRVLSRGLRWDLFEAQLRYRKRLLKEHVVNGPWKTRARRGIAGTLARARALLTVLMG